MGIDRYFDDQDRHRNPYIEKCREKNKQIEKLEERVTKLEYALTKIRDHNYINPKENFFVTDICEDIIGMGDMGEIGEKIREIGEMGGYK